MKSRLIAVRGYWSTRARMLLFHPAVLVMVFGVPLPSLTAMSTGEKGFVVLPGGAPRFSGNRDGCHRTVGHRGANPRSARLVSPDHCT